MKAKGEGGYLIWKMSVLMWWLLQKIFIGVENWKKNNSPRIHTVLTRTIALFLDIVENVFLAFFSDFISPSSSLF